MTDRAVIALDLYPANATVAGTTFTNCRAVVADGVVQLYKLTAAGPEVFFERAVNGGLGGGYAAGVAVPTEEGEVFVEKAGGCACGAVLATLDLFPGRQKVYTGLR